MELLLHSIKLDWPVLLPILICSILVVAVVINRFQFYKKTNATLYFSSRNYRRNWLKTIFKARKALRKTAAALSVKSQKKLSEFFRTKKRFFTFIWYCSSACNKKIGKPFNNFRYNRRCCAVLRFVRNSSPNSLHLPGFGNSRQPVSSSCNGYRFSVDCNRLRSWCCDCGCCILQLFPINSKTLWRWFPVD